MKKLIALISFSVVITIVILSCSKSGGTSSPQSSGCKITSWTQGLLSATDTANSISYDNNNHISRIISTYGGQSPDTFNMVYDGNGKLSVINQTAWSNPTSQTFTYINGLLSTCTYSYYFGYVNQTIISYGSNNLPSVVWNYNNNILTATDSLQFNGNGDLVSVTEIANGTVLKATMQYTSVKNSLSPIILLNMNNIMGLEDMFPSNPNYFEFFARYYSTHLISKCTFSDGNNITYSYNYDASQNVTKSIASLAIITSSLSYIFTRNYTYNCN